MMPTLKEFRDRLWAHELRTRGESLYQVGELEQAKHSFEEGLSLDPEDPILYYNLGVALECLGQNAAARRSFENALELAPGFEEAQVNLDSLVEG
jgi:tetratricopeptide (TPR) repeat protein